MRLFRSLLAGVLVLFLWGHFSFAQNEDALSGLSLEELLNTPIATATMAVKPLREAPATVFVITDTMIRERGYLYLYDALRDAPGIDLIWMGGLYGPILMQRGMDSPENNKLLLMIDGIVDNNLSAGTAQIYMQYSLQNVKRIEILFGPASALYGANAMTGLINIITKKGSDLQGFHVDGSGMVWDPEFRRGGASADVAAGKEWGKENQKIEASGWFHIVNTEGTDLRLSDKARSDLPQNPGAANYYFSPNHIGSSEVGTYLGQGRLSIQELGLTFGGYVWERRGGQGTFGHEGFAFLNGFQNKPDSWNFRNSTLFVSHDRKINEATSNTFSFVFRDTRILNDSYDAYFSTPGTGPDGPGLPGDAGVRYYRPDHSIKFEDRINWKFLSDMELTAGASAELQYVSDYQLSTGHSFDHQVLLDPGPKPVLDDNKSYDYDDYSAYVENVWQLSSDFSLTSGLRVDVFRLQGRNTPSFFGTKDYDAGGNCIPNAPECKTIGEATEAGAIEISNIYYLYAPFQRTRTTVNPRLGVVYSAQKRFTIKALYGEGFRMPTVREHFSVTNSRFSNPLLESEKIRTAELSGIFPFSNRAYVELDSFFTQAYQIVQLSPSSIKRPGRTTFLNQFQNIGKARIYGFDLKLQSNIRAGVDLFTNYSFQIPKYLEADPGTLSHEPGTASLQDSSDRIPRQAIHKGTIGASLAFLNRRLVFTPRVNFVGKRRSVFTCPIQEVPSYGSLNFSALVKDIGWKGFYGQFIGYNLTNSDILDPGFRTANKLDDFPAIHPQPGFHFFINFGYEKRF